jgi:flagellar biosynthesis GTPase FlhF
LQCCHLDFKKIINFIFLNLHNCPIHQTPKILFFLRSSLVRVFNEKIEKETFERKFKEEKEKLKEEKETFERKLKEEKEKFEEIEKETYERKLKEEKKETGNKEKRNFEITEFFAKIPRIQFEPIFYDPQSQKMLLGSLNDERVRVPLFSPDKNVEIDAYRLMFLTKDDQYVLLDKYEPNKGKKVKILLGPTGSGKTHRYCLINIILQFVIIWFKQFFDFVLRRRYGNDRKEH